MIGQGRRNVLGISGSLRERSSNTRLLGTAGELMASHVAYRLYDGLTNLPPFNPDLDRDGGEIHVEVQRWREALRDADAVVICTPEYARGVPGSLKNALDWVVSSGEFAGMPTAVVSASPHPDGGVYALESLKLTLAMMEAFMPDGAALAVPFVSTKLGADGGKGDPALLKQLHRLIQVLLEAERPSDRP